LAIDRKFFGFEGDISKTQIKNLRKQSCEFISTTFLADLTKTLTEWKAIDECKLIVQPVKDSDKDPQVIEIHYNSVIDTSEYLPQRVLIEVSSRSLMEPIEESFMIYGEALRFDQLVKRILELQTRINGIR
jgi:hypothetical protein